MYFNKIGKRPICDMSLMSIPFERACAYYEGWMRPVLASHNIDLSVNNHEMSLQEAVHLVFHTVHGPPYRRVFVEITDCQTLYFDNHETGGTVVPVSSMISKYLTCDVLHIMDYEPQETSLMIELYRSSDFSVRCMSWIDDGGGLELLSSGDHLPEETAVFSEQLKKLDSSILSTLVSSLGFSLDWNPEVMVRCRVFDEIFT